MSSTEEVLITHSPDRDAVWEKVKGRKILVLDTMVWIDMAEKKSPEAESLLAVLENHVASGRVLCPLTTCLIWELYKQKYSMHNTAQLMEKLSNNVCYAIDIEIYHWEILCFAKRLAGTEGNDLPSKMLYVPVSSYLSSRAEIIGPSDAPEAVKNQMRLVAEEVFKEHEALTLTDLLSIRTKAAPVDALTANTPNYQEVSLRYQNAFRGDKEKVRRNEEVSIYRQVIKPAMKQLPASLLRCVAKHMQSSPKDKYEGCLGLLWPEWPALHNHLEVMTLAAQDPNRKDKMNDFFDHELLPVPLAYADVFVSRDRRIRDLVTNRSNLLTRNKCLFISSYAELEQYLSAL